MIMPFTGLNLVTLFDLSQSNVEYIPSFMFQNCYNLEEVILGPSTITMYISAFENSAISKINLEYIKNIHDNAFFGCKNIKHVDIQNVTMFGSYCFSESGLIDFKFIQDVNEVAEGMFQHCVDLETVTLMPRIGIIEGNAFYQCIKLRNIDSLYHITRIGHIAFEYTSLTQIENNEILELDYNAFSNIVTLQSAIFRTIQTNCETFLNCINLKTIEIKEAYYVDLGYNFYNCLSLESFKSGQARVIADYDFANCRNLVTFDVPFVALLLKCCFKNCKPLTHFDYNPDYFYSAAFQGCSKLETVKFLHYGNFYLNTKKSLLGSYRPILSPITEYVFSECTSLKIIDTDYGEKGMFANCFSLTEVNFYGKSLSYGAFLNCINLKTIRFLNDQYSGPFKGDSIPCNCFYGCVNLEEINLPETVKTIENSAFYNTSLKNGIDLKNVQNIKPDSFSYSKVSSLKISKEVNINKNLYTLEHCDELKEIIFAGQGSIPLALLKNCPKFKTLKLSDKFTYQNGIVRRIDSQSGNSIVTYNISYESTEIIIPDDIKNIAFAAFLCSNLIKSIKINHDVKIGNFAFCNMESLEEVEINAKEIPAYCFYNCSKLSKVTLSNIVESIQYQAFSYTKLKQIDLPLSLKNIFRPFLLCPITNISFESNMNHPNFIITKNEFIHVNENNEKELLFIYGKTKNKIINISEGIKSIGIGSISIASRNSYMVNLPNSIEKLTFFESEDYSNLIPVLCYSGNSIINVAFGKTDPPDIEFHSVTYPEYYVDYIEVIKDSCKSNVTEENCTDDQIITIEETKSEDSLHSLEIALIIISLLFIASLIILLYTIYLYVKRDDEDESNTLPDMKIEETAIINTNGTVGFVYDNSLFSLSQHEDDPFKSDFDEHEDKKENDNFLGKYLEEY